MELAPRARLGASQCRARGRPVRIAGSVQAENLSAGFRHRASSFGLQVATLKFSQRLCPSVTRNDNAILATADYNKLIFPKGLSQRGHFGGVLPKPDA